MREEVKYENILKPVNLQAWTWNLVLNMLKTEDQHPRSPSDFYMHTMCTQLMHIFKIYQQQPAFKDIIELSTGYLILVLQIYEVEP